MRTVQLRIRDGDNATYKYSVIYKFTPIIMSALTILPYLLCLYFFATETNGGGKAFQWAFTTFNIIFAVFFAALYVAFYVFLANKRCESLVFGMLSMSSIPFLFSALGIATFLIQSVFFIVITLAAIAFVVSNFKRANDAVTEEMVENYAQDTISEDDGQLIYTHGQKVEKPVHLGRLAGRLRYFIEFVCAVPLIAVMVILWPFVFTVDALDKYIPMASMIWGLQIIMGLMTRGFFLNQGWFLLRVLRTKTRI